MECWYILTTAFNSFLTGGVQKAEIHIIEFGEDVIDNSRLYQLIIKSDCDKLESEIFTIAETVSQLCSDEVIHSIVKSPCEFLYRANGTIEKVSITTQDIQLSYSQDTDTIGSSMKICFKSSIITLQPLNECLCILSFLKSISIRLHYNSYIQSRELKSLYRISNENSLINNLSLPSDTFIELFDTDTATVCILISLREASTQEDSLIKLFTATNGDLNISSDFHIQILSSISLHKLGFHFTSEFDQSSISTYRPAQHSNGIIDSIIFLCNFSSIPSIISLLNSSIDSLLSKYSEIFTSTALDNSSYCMSAADSIVEIMKMMPANLLEDDIFPDELLCSQVGEILKAWSL